MSSSNKIQLVMAKNNKPTKNTLKVKPTITYDQFKKKISPNFTKKQFRLEYYSKQQQDWHELTQDTLNQLLSNYNKQIINIITAQQKVQISQKSLIQHSQYNNSISLNTELQPTNSIINQDSELLTKNKVDDELSIKEQLSQNLLKSFKNDIQGKQSFYKKGTDFDLTVKEIINIFADIALNQMHQKYQIIKQKESSIDLGKTCSQCKNQYFKGPYYLCLICQHQYILCSQCQATQILGEKSLTTHTAKSHPFAKIKRPIQTIKSKKVTTEPLTEIEFNSRNSNKIIKLGKQNETQKHINQQLLQKFNAIYTQLIQNSEFHHRNYYNPTNIPFSVRRRDNHLTSTIQTATLKSQSSHKQGQIQTNADLKELSDIDKQRKFKRLKRMGLAQEQIKKYTSEEYENKSYSEILKQLFENR